MRLIAVFFVQCCQPQFVVFFGSCTTQRSTDFFLRIANGKLITKVSEATEEDVDIAVEAAQKAFETSWGLNAPGSVRTDLLWKLAQLMERDHLELAALEALDNGNIYIYIYI